MHAGTPHAQSLSMHACRPPAPTLRKPPPPAPTLQEPPPSTSATRTTQQAAPCTSAVHQGCHAPCNVGPQAPSAHIVSTTIHVACTIHHIRVACTIAMHAVSPHAG